MRRLFYICVGISSLLFFSCDPWTVDNYYEKVPEAVLLDFTVKNDMGTTVTVKIRHKYGWDNGTDNYDEEYSNWSEENINGGDSKRIGVENPQYWDTSITDTGFVLLDRNIVEIVKCDYSSFELQIEIAKSVYTVTDSFPYNDRNGETALCFVLNGGKREVTFLNTFKQHIGFYGEELFVLPLTLTIHTDGTYDFDHEIVEGSNWVHVF